MPQGPMHKLNLALGAVPSTLSSHTLGHFSSTGKEMSALLAARLNEDQEKKAVTPQAKSKGKAGKQNVAAK